MGRNKSTIFDAHQYLTTCLNKRTHSPPPLGIWFTSFSNLIDIDSEMVSNRKEPAIRNYFSQHAGKGCVKRKWHKIQLLLAHIQLDLLAIQNISMDHSSL